MPTSACHPAELGSVDISPNGESFVLAFVAPNRDVHRIELPCWTVHQLMRLLPRVDAALAQARNEPASDLTAYPVLQWCVERSGIDDSVALSLRDARRIESAYLLEAGHARALHAALTEALAAAPPRPRAADRQPAAATAS